MTAQSTACATAGSCVTVTIDQNEGGVGFTLAGTWSGTVQFEGSADGGTTYQALNATPSNSSTAATSATGNGVWQANVAGFTQVRIRCSTFSSGTIVATINGSSASARTGGGSGGAASFSTLTTGTNTQPGVFTNAQQNETFQYVLGASCPQSTIIGGTTKVTDAFSACLNVPSGAGVTNGFSNAIAAYGENNNSSQLGQFGKAIVVGVYPAVACVASNTKCEGISPQVTDASSLTGVFLEGSEIGMVPQNTSDTGYGILLSFEGDNNQPVSATDNMPAVAVQTPTGSGTYTRGFECQDGSTASLICFSANVISTANGVNSQFAAFIARNAAGTLVSTLINESTDSVGVLATPHVAVNNTSGEESYEIELTATAALPIGTLVKIDTAHADSVVICTTADTSCDGFVQGTNTASQGLCLLGSLNCPIAMGSGSKVQGILGTGTCSIGNFVIVDTTTNGDVKCTASLPAQGAYIGKALAANSTVGTKFDILTKFQ